MMSSTLVETVSINYDDFNESFLTCGTCLCTYDQGGERAPKLLPCSHTVCRNCLERIIAAQTLDTGSFRCPICRENVQVPQGGVPSFPPSFIVNQLLDLMAQQRRDVVPKCATHPQQELFFCETCDVVFCAQCVDNSHTGRGASEHTVIPFAIAIKRMSEILLYKAHLCIKNLNSAYDAVSSELRQLELSTDKTLDCINKSFQDVLAIIERRKQECLQWVRKVREDKRTILREQLDLIQAEKEKVQRECDGLQYQVEVRNITKKISDLNEKLDTTSTLSEPRENSFLRYEYKHNDALREIAKAISQFGSVRVSTTFPALTTAVEYRRATAHLRSSVRVNAVDYHGNPRTSGGDPVVAELRTERGDAIDLKITDNADGTYDLKYVPTRPGKLKLSVCIFGRPIKDNPLCIETGQHIDPIWKLGGVLGGVRGSISSLATSEGAGRASIYSASEGPSSSVEQQQSQLQEQQQPQQPLRLNMPTRVAAAPGGQLLYVLDTGNSRLCVVNARDGSLQRCLSLGRATEGASATGLAVVSGGTMLAVVNWRSQTVYVVDSSDGQIVKEITTLAFVEPIDVAVNSKGEIIVADSGARKIFKFDTQGNLITSFGSHGDRDGQFKVITALCVGRNDEILVADHRIQVFTKDGKFSRRLQDSLGGDSGNLRSGSEGGAVYGGVVVDQSGWILATVTEKGKSVEEGGAGDRRSGGIGLQEGRRPSREKSGAGSMGKSAVNVYSAAGKLLYMLNSHGDKLRRPQGLAVMADFRVGVADLGNNCIKAYYYK
ncbi:cellular tumor antigen p53 [Plakobranchus ocellatus]|uniref:Cellular tumor antigen p53 n=1 Tax=Plakobranchus ocellatus TaxID=259542 RepID=A0AAV4BSH1_9GAST|nr:cellular tumor antigen p53 [Plakobranchus ocellatus]